MKSLHQFMFDKRLQLAVRFDDNAPSVQHLDLKTTQGNSVKYRLLSLPHYFAGRLPDLVSARLRFSTPRRGSPGSVPSPRLCSSPPERCCSSPGRCSYLGLRPRR